MVVVGAGGVGVGWGGGGGLESERGGGGFSVRPGCERRKNNWCANGCLSLVPG